MPKPEREFFDVAGVDWIEVPGPVAGLSERVLARDEAGDVATRILRFAPGTDTRPNGVQAHEFWEEAYILEGSQTDLTLGQTFSSGMYACRPPGMRHGPWISEDGCVLFEVRYRV